MADRSLLRMNSVLEVDTATKVSGLNQVTTRSADKTTECRRTSRAGISRASRSPIAEFDEEPPLPVSELVP